MEIRDTKPIAGAAQRRVEARKATEPAGAVAAAGLLSPAEYERLLQAEGG